MKQRCEFCDKEFTTTGRLQVHLEKVHSIDIEQFYLRELTPPLCPICNNPKKFISLSKGYALTCGNRSCSSKLANINGKDKHIQSCKDRNARWKSEILPNGKTKQQTIIDKGQSKRDAISKETGQKISNSLKANAELMEHLVNNNPI